MEKRGGRKGYSGRTPQTNRDKRLDAEAIRPAKKDKSTGVFSDSTLGFERSTGAFGYLYGNGTSPSSDYIPERDKKLELKPTVSSNIPPESGVQGRLERIIHPGRFHEKEVK